MTSWKLDREVYAVEDMRISSEKWEGRGNSFRRHGVRIHTRARGAFLARADEALALGLCLAWPVPGPSQCLRCPYLKLPRMPKPHFPRFRSCLPIDFTHRLLSCIYVSRDLKLINNSQPEVQQALANQIRDACINVGFFYGATLANVHKSLLISRCSRESRYL